MTRTIIEYSNKHLILPASTEYETLYVLVNNTRIISDLCQKLERATRSLAQSVGGASEARVYVPNNDVMVFDALNSDHIPEDVMEDIEYNGTPHCVPLLPPQVLTNPLPLDGLKLVCYTINGSSFYYSVAFMTRHSNDYLETLDFERGLLFS